MPNYQYVAQNEEGKSLKGILRSDNERAARQEIKSKNMTRLNFSNSLISKNLPTNGIFIKSL